mgnify:CR=1 FL=1
MKFAYFFLASSLIHNHCIESAQQPFHTKFKIKELSYYVAEEVTSVCDIFQDPDIADTSGGTPDLIRIFITESPWRFLVCQTIDNPTEACGTLGFTHNQQKTAATFEVIAVKKEFQRQGIASALMAYAQYKYTFPSVRKIVLHTKPSNESAIACYQKQKFTMHGNQPGQHCAECHDTDTQVYCMEKNIIPATTQSCCWSWR